MISAILVAFLCIINFSVGAQSNGPILDGRGPLKHGLSKRQSLAFGDDFDSSEFSNACRLPLSRIGFTYEYFSCRYEAPGNLNNNPGEAVEKVSLCSGSFINVPCKQPYFYMEFNLQPEYRDTDIKDLTLAMSQQDFEGTGTKSYSSYNLLAFYGLSYSSGITANKGKENLAIVNGDFPFTNSYPNPPKEGVEYNSLYTRFFFAYDTNGVTIGYNNTITAQLNDPTVLEPVFDGGNLIMRLAEYNTDGYFLTNIQMSCLGSDAPCGVFTTTEGPTEESTTTETSISTEKSTSTLLAEVTDTQEQLLTETISIVSSVPNIIQKTELFTQTTFENERRVFEVTITESQAVSSFFEVTATELHTIPSLYPTYPYSNDNFNGDNYGDGNFNDGNYGDGNFNDGNYDDGNFNGDNYGDGNYDDGNYDDGNYDDGNYDDGNYDDGNYDDGNYDDGNYDDGNYDDGNYDDGNYDDGNYDDGNYDDGNYDDGNYDDGNFNGDNYGDGNYDDGNYDDGSYNDGNY